MTEEKLNDKGLREATIILPLNFNDGATVPQVLHDRWIERICLVWGGCTVSEPKKGYWYSKESKKLYKDDVITVKIAMDAHNPFNTEKLIEIADLIREEYKQECIYVKTASGWVHFV